MENFNRIVYDLVKEGSIDNLKQILSDVSVSCLNNLFTMKYDGGVTLLIAASKNGSKDIVKILLEKGADPLYTGTVTFDGELITKVPPLWAAAAAGHLDVCKVLIAHGANINQATNTNSTPLRGACYDGHLEIVNYLVENGADIEIANRHGHTALMIAAFREQTEVVRYLLSIGAKIDRTSMKGFTVLHDASESGNLDIIKMLLDYGATQQPDDYGVTPLISAAMSGHLEAVQLLFPYTKDPIERHNSLKLLGATYVDKKLDFVGAINLWKNSFDFNYINAEEQCSFGFIPELTGIQKETYGNYSETRSLSEIDRLIADPEAIRMQALIIRERVLGQSHPDTHFYLRYRGAFYLDIGDWTRAWRIWTYILQLEQYYTHSLSHATLSTFYGFIESFAMLTDEIALRSDTRNLTGVLALDQMLVVMDRAVYEAERFMYHKSLKEDNLSSSDDNFEEELENYLGIILHLVYLIGLKLKNMESRKNNQRNNEQSSLSNINEGSSVEYVTVEPPTRVADLISASNTLSPNNSVSNSKSMKVCPCSYPSTSFEQRPKCERLLHSKGCSHLKCLLHRGIKIFQVIDPSISTLHIAFSNIPISSEIADFYRRPISYFVIEELLLADAKINSIDRSDDTPLHVLLKNTSDIKDRERIVKLLLDWGAPLMARNIDDETCLDLFRYHSSMARHIKPVRYISLKQLAANVIMKNLSGTASFRGILPKSLEDFLALF